MRKYLFDDNVIDYQHFSKALENAVYKEYDDEKFCEYVDNYYTPYGIEIGDSTFYASDILYKMDKKEYDKQKEIYFKNQLDSAWDELEKGGFIIVAGIAFEIQYKE